MGEFSIALMVSSLVRLPWLCISWHFQNTHRPASGSEGLFLSTKTEYFLCASYATRLLCIWFCLWACRGLYKTHHIVRAPAPLTESAKACNWILSVAEMCPCRPVRDTRMFWGPTSFKKSAMKSELSSELNFHHKLFRITMPTLAHGVQTESGCALQKNERSEPRPDKLLRREIYSFTPWQDLQQHFNMCSAKQKAKPGQFQPLESQAKELLAEFRNQPVFGAKQSRLSLFHSWQPHASTMMTIVDMFGKMPLGILLLLDVIFCAHPEEHTANNFPTPEWSRSWYLTIYVKLQREFLSDRHHVVIIFQKVIFSLKIIRRLLKIMQGTKIEFFVVLMKCSLTSRTTRPASCE